MSMLKEVVLLTGDVEGPYLTKGLKSNNPDLHVRVATDRATLEASCQSGSPETRRLIAFCTGLIVPSKVLAEAMTPAYNFHPGPPNYPGSFCAGFAVYEGAERFGITVHEMTSRVDEGAIVAVEWFKVPPQADREQLEAASFQLLIEKFFELAPHFANSAEPLPQIDERWSGPKRTKADVEAYRQLPDDVSDEEAQRRLRAFG